MKAPFFVALLLALFGASAAQAADIDFGPLVQAGLEYLIVPLLGAGATYLATKIGGAATRYLDAKSSNLFAQNVDGVLQKAISFGAVQARAQIGNKNLHANVDGWIASYAATYAVSHAPDLMKQAGDISQKIVARLADHADVAELKATLAADGAGAPIELHAAAA